MSKHYVGNYVWGGLEPRWYNANLIFALGMLVAKYDSSFKEFFRKNYCLKMAVVGIAFLCLSVWYSMEKGSIPGDLLKLADGSVFCLFFWGISLKVRFQSKIIRWSGQKSLYLYMIHLEIWKIFDILFKTHHFQFVICLIGTFIVTFLYCKMEEICKRKFLKQRKE